MSKSVMIVDSDRGDATWDRARKEVTVFRDSDNATMVTGASGKTEAIKIAMRFLDGGK